MSVPEPESVERVGNLIRVVQVGMRGLSVAPGAAAIYFSDEPPSVPGPWVWYKTEGGVLVDIVIEVGE